MILVNSIFRVYNAISLSTKNKFGNTKKISILREIY